MKTCKKCGHDEKEHREWHGLKNNWKCFICGCSCEKFEAEDKKEKSLNRLKRDFPEKSEKELKDLVDNGLRIAELKPQKSGDFNNLSECIQYEKGLGHYIFPFEVKTFIKKIEDNVFWIEDDKGKEMWVVEWYKINKLAGEELTRR
ncbi:hypothetical protein LCGC14_0477830 [marine sediment metagenome]|uniref:Uncharacterized protein n=1 Tax=marine sediment metagenome TaxID=412755 RepID=A0A0F9STD4_9ZZZZ